MNVATSKEDIQLSEYFHSREFRCKCCGHWAVDRTLLDRLAHARGIYNKPMEVLSGYPCPRHNAAVGGTKNSYHLQGKAADIMCSSSLDRFNLVAALLAAGFTRIGLYAQGFVHADVGESPKIAMWVK